MAQPIEQNLAFTLDKHRLLHGGPTVGLLWTSTGSVSVLLWASNIRTFLAILLIPALYNPHIDL